MTAMGDSVRKLSGLLLVVSLLVAILVACEPPAQSCTAAVGIGDSRTMVTSYYQRDQLIATGATGDPFPSVGPVLSEAPQFHAVMGDRYDSTDEISWVTSHKTACPGVHRTYFTILGPNHLSDGSWDAADTTAMYAMFDLMSAPDSTGATGSIRVTGMFYGPNAPSWYPAASLDHDRAVTDYIAAHPDRDVRLVPIDPTTIDWPSSGDGVHPTEPASKTGPAAGQDQVVLAIYRALA